jgi:ubiquinone/menaquinone biosynthesis C-methylase UbiE
VKDGLLLEVGVGSGRVAFSLMRELAPQFIGFDLSKEMLKIAKRKCPFINRNSTYS